MGIGMGMGNDVYAYVLYVSAKPVGEGSTESVALAWPMPCDIVIIHRPSTMFIK